MRMYTSTEKETHVQEALAFVASGQGSINTYCRMVDIPRTTFHRWVHQGEGSNNVPKAAATGLVRIKKAQPPMSAPSPEPKPISVDYYGARIEVAGEDALLALLRNLRAASNELK